MKVTHNPTPNTTRNIEKPKTSEKVSNASKKEAEATGPSLAAQAGSNIEISDKARLMQGASEIVRNSPDVHKEKVAALKKSIQEGNYKIDSEKVAERILEEHLNSDFGKNNL